VPPSVDGPLKVPGPPKVLGPPRGCGIIVLNSEQSGPNFLKVPNSEL
jgi:hypothetical protein